MSKSRKPISFKKEAPRSKQRTPEAYWPGWSTFRSKDSVLEKKVIASYFADHDFLVPEDGNPGIRERLHAATILVNPGTTPDTVVQTCLDWMKDHWKDKGPFSVMWYTPGALVASSIRNFREENQNLRAAAELFLFPGQVDPDVESVLGNVTVEFVQRQLNTRFKYSILSAWGLDLATGYTYFHYSPEVSLQKACAGCPAAQKFLFVDPNKLMCIEGEQGYSVRDLLDSADSVAIYTVDSEDSDFIKERFNKLQETLLDNDHSTSSHTSKTLRLTILGCDHRLVENIVARGELRH